MAAIDQEWRWRKLVRADEPIPTTPDSSAEQQAQGYEQGYRQGLEKAQAEADKSLAAQVALFRDLLNGAQQELVQLKADLAKDVLAMTAQLSGAVLQQKLFTSQEHFEQACAKLAAQLPTQEETINVALHPDDLAQLVEHLGDDFPYVCIADPMVAPSAIRLNQGATVLELDVKANLEAILSEVGETPLPTPEVADDSH